MQGEVVEVINNIKITKDNGIFTAWLPPAYDIYAWQGWELEPLKSLCEECTLYLDDGK